MLLLKCRSVETHTIAGSRLLLRFHPSPRASPSLSSHHTMCLAISHPAPHCLARFRHSLPSLRPHTTHDSILPIAMVRLFTASSASLPSPSTSYAIGIPSISMLLHSPSAKGHNGTPLDSQSCKVFRNNRSKDISSIVAAQLIKRLSLMPLPLCSHIKAFLADYERQYKDQGR